MWLILTVSFSFISSKTSRVIYYHQVHSIKRRKTDPEIPLKFQVGEGRASKLDLYMLPTRRISKLSVSEPVTRASSALFGSTSQPSGSRRMEKSRQSSSPRKEHKSPSVSAPNPSSDVLLVLEPAVILDDYNGWEQGLFAEDLKQVQNHSGMIYFYVIRHSYSLCWI